MLSWVGLIISEKLVMDRGVTPDASCAYEGIFALVIIGAVSSPIAAVYTLWTLLSPPTAWPFGPYWASV